MRAWAIVLMASAWCLSVAAGQRFGCVVTAGGGGGGGSGSPAAFAGMTQPWPLAWDAAGGIYVGEMFANKLSYIAPTTSVISTVSVNLAVTGVAVGPGGRVYMSQQTFHRLAMWSAATGVVAFAGTGVAGGSGDGGLASAAQLNAPQGMSVHTESGTLAVAENGGWRIRLVNLTSGVISTLVSSAIGIGNVLYHQTPARMLYAAVQGDLYRVAPDGGMTLLASSLNAVWGMALQPDATGLYFGLRGAHTIHYMFLNNNSYITVAGSGQGFADNKPPLAAAFDSPRGVLLAPDGVVYVGDVGNGRVRALVPQRFCDAPAQFVGCRLTPAGPIACDFIAIGGITTLAVTINGVTCPSVTPIVNASATATCFVPPPLPFAVRWTTMVGSGNTTVGLPAPMAGLRLVAHNLPVAAGDVASFQVEGSVSAFVANVVLLPSLQSVRRMACFDATFAESGAAPVVTTINCTLRLALEEGYTAPLLLQMQLSNGGTVSLPVNVTAPLLRSRLPSWTAPVLSTSGGQAVTIALPITVPSAGEVAVWAPALTPVCGGTAGSALRCWVGATPCSACAWLNESAVRCTAPPGTAAFARVTVEVCGQYNATTDGGASLAALTPNATVAAYVSYVPAALFSQLATAARQTVRHAALNTFALPVVPTLWPLLDGNLVTALIVGGVACPNVTGNATVLLCGGWSAVTAALPFPPEGTLDVSLAADFRGQRVVLPSVLLVAAPRLDFIDPPTALPGACISVYGSWLTPPILAPPVLSLSTLTCTTVTRVSFIFFSCCLPAVVPVTTPGFPFLPAVIRNARGASEESATVQVLTPLAVAVAIPQAARTAATALPVLAAATRLDVALSLNGSSVVTCTLAVVSAACPALDAFAYGAPTRSASLTPALVGAGDVITTLLAQTSAVVPFPAVAVMARFGCNLTVGATCADDLRRSASTASGGQLTLTLPNATGRWSAGTPGIAAPLIVPPEGALPQLSALVELSRAPVNATVAGLWACLATLVPAALVPPPTFALAPQQQSLSTTAGTPAGATATLATTAFTGLATTGAGLGQRLAVHAECLYTPSEERIRLPPLDVAVPNVTATLSSPAGGSTVDGYTQLVLSGALAVQPAAFNFSSAGGTCRVTLASASSPLVALSSATASALYSVGDDGSIVPPLAAVLEAPPSSTAQLQVVCAVWGRAVTSNAITLTVKPFTVSFAPLAVPPRGLPSSALAQDATAFFPLAPSLEVNTTAATAVACTMVAGSPACPPRGFRAYGVGFVPLEAPAVALVGATSVAASTGAVLASGLAVRAASGCVVPVTATCRDTVGRENATLPAVNVTVTALSAAWWLGGGGLDSAALWFGNDTAAAVTLAPSPFPPVWMQVREDGARAPVDRQGAWTCAALLVDAAVVVPVASPLSSFARGVGVYAEAATPALLAGGPPQSQASLVVDALDATAFPLGARLRLHGECVWTPTGERVRLAPADVSLPNVTVAASHSPAVATAGGQVEGYSPVNVTVLVDAWASDAACAVEVTAASTPLLVQSTTTAIARTSVPAGVAVQLPVVLEGPPLSSAALIVRCQLWGGAYTVTSAPIGVRLRQFTVAWSGAAGNAARDVLPSSASSSDADAFFPITPPLEVTTTLRTSVVCTLALASPVPSCPSGPLALAGTLTAAATAATDAATTAVVAFPGAGLRGGFGCRAAVVATCRDALNRDNATATATPLALPAAAMEWMPAGSVGGNAWQAVGAPLPPLPLPDTAASISLSPSLPTPHRSWQCIAAVLPGGWAVSASSPLTALPRSAGSFADGIVAASAPAATATYRGLDASFLALNATAQAAAECTWLPTGERLRTSTWRGTVADVSVAWTSQAAGTTLVTLPGQPVELQATVVTNVPLAAVTCAWRTTNASTSLLLQSTGATAVNVSGSAALRTTVTLQGPTGASLTALLECTALGKALPLPPVVMRTATVSIVPVSLPSPLLFVPSEMGAPWVLRPGLSVRLASEDGSVARSVTCRLFSAHPAAQLHATGSGGPSVLASGVASDAATGVVAFPLFGIQAAFNASSDGQPFVVGLQVLCTTAGGDSPPPLVIAVTMVHMRAAVCAQPTVAMPSGDALPEFAVQLSAGEVLPAHPSGSASCSPSSPPAGISWPLVSCSVVDGRADAASGGGNASVLLLGGGSQSASGGRVAFPRVTVTGAPGQTYPLQVACTVGGVVIPTTLPGGGAGGDASTGNLSVRLTGCRAGQQVIDITCVPCPSWQFSLGDAAASASAPGCRGCPVAGARCTDGVIMLLPNFYRPATQAAGPIGPDTEMHPCFNTEACLVYNATAAVTHTCAPGYSGALCGVCAPGYTFYGPVCRTCWSEAASNALLAVLVLAVLAALTYLALRRSDGTKRPAGIALKILLSYLQAVGSLKAFQAGGTRAYRDLFGWTDTLSASPLSIGALQCVVHPTFLAQYLSVLALPLLASCALAAIFLAVTTVRHVRFVDGRLTLATAECMASLRAWWGERRHVALFLFAVFVTYMSLISASLRALDCTAPVDGVRYLRSDLSVPCGVGQQAVARVFAGITLVGMGVGIPVALVVVLARRKPSQLLQPAAMAAWGFLVDGYRTSFTVGSWQPPPAVLTGAPRADSGAGAGARDRVDSADADPLAFAVNPLHAGGSGAPRAVTGGKADVPVDEVAELPAAGAVKVKDRRLLLLLTACMPRHLLWWEAVVLLRKVGIVLLAVLVTDPYAQCAGAILLLTACLGGQLVMQPFTRPLFNLLESWSLAAAVASATLSTLLLQYAGAADFANREAPAMDGKEWFVTIALASINMLTVVVLGATFLRLQLTEVRAKARVALSKSSRLRNSSFLRGGAAAAIAVRKSSAKEGVAATPGDDHVANPLHAAGSTRRVHRSSTVAPAQPPVTAIVASAVSPLRSLSNSSMPDAPDSSAVLPGVAVAAAGTPSLLASYRPGRAARQSLVGGRNTFAAVGLPRRATIRGTLGLPATPPLHVEGGDDGHGVPRKAAVDCVSGNGGGGEL